MKPSEEIINTLILLTEKGELCWLFNENCDVFQANFDNKELEITSTYFRINQVKEYCGTYMILAYLRNKYCFIPVLESLKKKLGILLNNESSK